MGLNATPSANRIHIGFFGRRNVGKSSLVNAVTGQKLSVVSDTKGTTTDPVYKSMELLPLGPVLIIDTPGIDDEGELGHLRMEKTKQVLNKTDMAVLVVEAGQIIGEYEKELKRQFEIREIPYLIVCNKCDLMDKGKKNTVVNAVFEDDDLNADERMDLGENLTSDKKLAFDKALNTDKNTGSEKKLTVDNMLYVSSKQGEGIEELKNRMSVLIKAEDIDKKIVGDLIKPFDTVVLVIPIDASAPKGRLILPQQQVIRDILDAGGICVTVKDKELEGALDKLGTKPYMVITDSQAFGEVSKIVPKDIYLTSFSILMARWKGFLKTAVAGAYKLSDIHDGDEILISEGCTHHRQCEDIGTVKLPKLISTFSKAEPKFTFTSGGDYPEELGKYKLVIQCGGCMLNERTVRYRMKLAAEQGIPFTNYGTAIAYMNGILERSVDVLKDEL